MVSASYVLVQYTNPCLFAVGNIALVFLSFQAIPFTIMGDSITDVITPVYRQPLWSCWCLVVSLSSDSYATKSKHSFDSYNWQSQLVLYTKYCFWIFQVVVSYFMKVYMCWYKYWFKAETFDLNTKYFPHSGFFRPEMDSFSLMKDEESSENSKVQKIFCDEIKSHKL